MSSADEIRRAQRIIILKDRLRRVTDSIDRVVREIGATTETSSAYWERVNIRLRAEYRMAQEIMRGWATSEIQREYLGKLSAVIRDIKGRVIRPANPVDYKAFSKSNNTKQSLAALLEETLTAYTTGLVAGQATLIRVGRLTQQVLISEAKVNKAIASGFFESGSGSVAKRRLRDALLKKALDGKYVVIVDKNGELRQYAVDNYAEMVARTKLAEASTQAVLDTSATVGNDLVQVSAHNTKCEICAEFEGKIYSLSGSDPDFPVLSDEPPFHPNCQHSISIVYKEALQRDGTLSKYIDFSNGESDQHPTRGGWIPVADRELH